MGIDRAANVGKYLLALKMGKNTIRQIIVSGRSFKFLRKIKKHRNKTM